jgi:SNF family Na+-dependent transporter
MTEQELIQEFQKNRLHIILAQLAPTALLAFSVVTVESIATSGDYVKHAFALILLASGILGALAEYSAASQAQAAIDDLKSLPGQSALRSRVIAFRPWLEVVKFVTPVIFVAIFAFLLVALYL